jgi:hypothetical protein
LPNLACKRRIGPNKVVFGWLQQPRSAAVGSLLRIPVRTYRTHLIRPQSIMPFDENKREPITASDTPNATKFDPDEVSEPTSKIGRDALLLNRNCRTRQKEFKIFKWINKDRGDRRKRSNNTLLHRSMDRKHRFDAIAGQLDLTDHQKRVGRRLRDSQCLRRMGCEDQYTAFCLCVFICRYGKYATRTPEESRRIYHPTRSPENNDARFVKLAERLCLDEQTIAKVMGRMANRLPDRLTWN